MINDLEPPVVRRHPEIGPLRTALRDAGAVAAATRLAVIGMGKAGARELNYVSDVDVIFVAESADEEEAV